MYSNSPKTHRYSLVKVRKAAKKPTKKILPNSTRLFRKGCTAFRDCLYKILNSCFKDSIELIRHLYNLLRTTLKLSF